MESDQIQKNKKSYFKVVVIMLLLLDLVGYLYYFYGPYWLIKSLNINGSNVGQFSLAVVPIPLLVLGIYGLIKKKNKALSILAIISVLPIIFLISVLSQGW